jgi:hypothetical protein
VRSVYGLLSMDHPLEGFCSGHSGRLGEQAANIDMKDAFSLFEHFDPGQTLPVRAKRIWAVFNLVSDGPPDGACWTQPIRALPGWKRESCAGRAVGCGGVGRASYLEGMRFL